MTQTIRTQLVRGLFLCVTLLLGVGVLSGLWAQTPLLTEDFPTSGTLTAIPNSWSAHSGAGTNSIQANTPGLSYTGLTTSGGSATLTTSGEDINRKFTEQSSGAVYASFLINVTAAQNTGDYFLHLAPTTFTNQFAGRVFVKNTNNGFLLGVSKSAETAAYSGATYLYGTTYLLVLKYTFVSGSTTNDLIDLFIQPVLGQAESTPTISTSSTASTDLTNAGSIILRQGTAANAPSLRVDYIRVGTTWASVTADVPTLTASPTALTGANGLTYIEGNTPTSTTVSVSGSSLAPEGGVITAASSSTAFTVTSATTPTISTSAVTPTTYTVQSVTGLTAGIYSATLTFAGGGATAVVPVSATVVSPLPALAATPTSLANFTTLTGTASSPKTYTLTGNFLTSDVTVSAPAGFEVSTDGTTFAPSATVAQVSGAVSQTIAVRLASSAVAGPFSGTITNVSGSATATVAVDGTVSLPPSLTVTPTSLPTFTTLTGAVSAPQVYTLAGSSLTSNVVVSAPAGFEVSTDGAAFAPTVTVAQVSGTVSQTLAVRLASSAIAGPFSGSITNISGSATATVAVDGTVQPQPTLLTSATALSSFSATQGTASASQSYTLSALNLSDVLTVTAPSGVAVSLDNATFSPSLTLPQSTTSAVIYARLPAVSTGTISGTITNVSGSLSANVAVSGTVSATMAPGIIVISQVYGGGGNTGATYKNDFVELFNRGSSPITVTGWSVQYASSSGTSWQVTNLTGTIPAGGYYLVQEAAGTGGTVDLPTPNATGSIAMAAGAGKIALVNTTTPLSGSCPLGASVIDLVGYGAANCSEGSGPTPTLTSTASASRINDGCTDTDDNAADFTVGTVAPRNSSSPLNLCNPTGPTITATPRPLSLTYVEGSGPATRTVTVNAVNLTPDAGDVTVTSSSTAILVSYNGSAFGSSVTIPYSNSGLTNATVSAQLVAGLSIGSYPASLSFVGGGAIRTLAVTGTVSASVSTGLVPISTARAGINNTYTIQGRVTSTTQLGSRQIYIQDATGGIAVYSGASGPDFSTLVNFGDLVTVSGPVTVYNGALEITGTGNFTVAAGDASLVPTPVAVTPDQLVNYPGQLVSIANATVTPVAAVFSGGTNYTITAGGQASTLRISANSPLSGAGQPANPVSVTGIADRFVSAATSLGSDGFQIQPRILADIPGATPAQDFTCTVPGSTTLTKDQTLDIAAWNMEFFGADAGTINCPPSTTLVYNDMGPVNEDLQQTNAVTVLTRLNADIIATEEVSDIVRFDAAVKSIPGSYSYVCSDKFSYFFQNECDQVPSGGTVFGPTKFAQKVCVIYNTATVTPVLAETKPLLFQKTPDYTYPTLAGGNGSGSGWASGRLPFLFVANVTIGGVTRKVHVVAVHGKSGSASADFNRRVQDYNDLKAELDQNYPKANIIILGDYNDKATSSIYTSSPISSFNSFVTDAPNYSVISKPLEQNGCVTYNPSGGSFIDHMVISNDLQAGYVANSASVFQPFSIPNYGNTTSDHSPIEARFDLTQLPVSLTATLVASTTSVCVGTPVNFSVTVSGLDNGQVYSYTVSNGTSSTSATGVSSSVVQTSLVPTTTGAQTFTVTVAGASGTPVSTATVSVSVIAPPTLSITANPSTTIVGGANTTLTASGAATYVWSTGPTSESIVVNTAGVYSVTGTNASGCSAVASVTLTATDLSPTINLPQANFNAGESQNFVVSIFEVGGQPTAMGNIAITITGPVGYSLAFNPAINSIGVQNVSGGTDNVAVGNANWTVTSTLENRQISLVVNAGQFIAAGGASSLGFTLTRTGAGTGSTSSITVNISNDASKTYDGNATNNVYTRIISGI